MHILEFPDTNIVRYIPAELSECDASQYIFMCNLFFLYQCGEITKDEMLNNAVYHLMNMKPSKSTSIGNEDKTNIVLIEELIESSFFDKLFKSDDENDYQLKLKQNYINNPVPEYKPLWRNYYGPTDGFMNMKFGEYCEALRTFLEFNATGNTNLLYELAAILYRPRKPFLYFRKKLSNYDGDVRVKYNMHQTEKRIEAFNTLTAIENSLQELDAAIEGNKEFKQDLVTNIKSVQHIQFIKAAEYKPDNTRDLEEEAKKARKEELAIIKDVIESLPVAFKKDKKAIADLLERCE